MQRFTRFVVITNGRSGSNLLVLGLQQNPRVMAYGELLAEHEYERQRDASVLGLTHYRNGDDVVKYLSQVVFSFRPTDEPRAVGFKIFYNHARKNKAVMRAWDYLIAEKDIHIVHLVRRNLFECCVSHEVCYRTDVWAREREDRTRPPDVPSFRIAPQKCEGFIKTMLDWRKWAFDSFKKHPQIVVEYEKDLCRDYQKSMDRVFHFLGVPGKKIEKLLVKQATKPPREQVSNFVELKRFFSGTAYGVFFR